MTYQEIIQLFETICADHYQVNEFSTSPLLTDLEVGVKGSQTPAVYPYVFLQPTPSRLEKGSMIYTFNMIVMNRVKRDQDKEVDQISDMIQIGQDIIAYFNFKVPRPDALIQLPVQVTPFVEKFDGLVTGATFQISVQTPFILDMCIAPYKTQVPPPPPPAVYRLGNFQYNRTLGPTDPGAREAVCNGDIEGNVVIYTEGEYDSIEEAIKGCNLFYTDSNLTQVLPAGWYQLPGEIEWGGNTYEDLIFYAIAGGCGMFDGRMHDPTLGVKDCDNPSVWVVNAFSVCRATGICN